MELLRPDRLAWLGVLPLLYLLSRPPRPRRVELTAHLTQWLHARARLHRRPVRFRWWRFLLLLLAAAALVLAHAGPRHPPRPGPSRLIVVLDASASMAARTESGASAFDVAREAVLQRLATLPAHVDVRVALCREVAEILTGSRDAVAPALRAATPWGRGLVALDAVAHGWPADTTAVWTLGDGLGRSAAPRDGAWTRVGKPADNTALVGCRVDDGWPLPEVKVTLQVANHGPARTVALWMHGDPPSPSVGEVPPPTLALAAQETLEVVVEVRRAAGGSLWCELRDTGDVLPLDDRLRIDLPVPPQPDIAVRTAGAAPKPLVAIANALASECGGKVVEGVNATHAGLVLCDGGTLADPVPAAARVVTFGTALDGRGATIDTPRLLDWERRDPITAGLDLSELRVKSALSWPPGFPGTALLHGERGPLAVLRRNGDGLALHFAFRLEDSNLFKLAAFPQLVRRAFARAFGSGARPKVDPAALLDADESRLAAAAAVPDDRPLPRFGTPARSLVRPLLLAALVLLVLRAYLRP
ncbi:MAG: VWA domain-containing protein [Planctomycetes bacterium]|nr:VWA domain-containing protein [Planctomycetota bacterium]